MTQFEGEVATLIERSINIQADVIEIKELLKLQNGRLKKAEDDLTAMKLYWQALLAISTVIGTGVSLVVNFFVPHWLEK